MNFKHTQRKMNITANDDCSTDHAHYAVTLRTETMVQVVRVRKKLEHARSEVFVASRNPKSVGTEDRY
jgi:hypothetical protein